MNNEPPEHFVLRKSKWCGYVTYLKVRGPDDCSFAKDMWLLNHEKFERLPEQNSSFLLVELPSTHTYTHTVIFAPIFIDVTHRLCFHPLLLQHLHVHMLWHQSNWLLPALLCSPHTQGTLLVHPQAHWTSRGFPLEEEGHWDVPGNMDGIENGGSTLEEGKACMET